jgi:hypothetical protein
MSALPLNADIRDAKSNVREWARKLTRVTSVRVRDKSGNSFRLYLNDIWCLRSGVWAGLPASARFRVHRPIAGRLILQAKTSSRSAPKKISPSQTNVGVPNTPFAYASTVRFVNASWTLGSPAWSNILKSPPAPSRCGHRTEWRYFEH